MSDLMDDDKKIQAAFGHAEVPTPTKSDAVFVAELRQKLPQRRRPQILLWGAWGSVATAMILIGLLTFRSAEPEKIAAPVVANNSQEEMSDDEYLAMVDAAELLPSFEPDLF